jgi:hypothetical protein
MGLFRSKENPFQKLEERLRAEEGARHHERKVSAGLCRMVFRKWNRPIVRLLKQLSKALSQASEWESRNLYIGVFAPLDSGFRSIGWRLYWIRPYGVHGHWVIFRECESLDVVTISLRLNKSGQPVAFSLFKEDDGQRVTTKGLSRDELIADLQHMFT